MVFWRLALSVQVTECDTCLWILLDKDMVVQVTEPLFMTGLSNEGYLA
jgi:hypothetical protein